MKMLVSQGHIGVMILIVCRLIVIILVFGKIKQGKIMPEHSTNDWMILETFGKEVRARRDALGISQEELAELTGLHRTYIGGVEQGRRNLSLLNIVRLAKGLNTSPAALFPPIL